MIPKILHFVWVGGRPLPDRYEANVGEWKRLHPGWDCCIWREVPKDAEWAWVERCESRPVMLADLLRVEMVYRYGGVYADLDSWPVQSIERLIDGCRAFVGRNRGGEIDNPIFGAEEQHAWLRDVLSKIWMHYRPGVAMGLMGANLFCRTISRHPDVRVFPSELVNEDPVTGPGPLTFVLHAADRSWKKPR